MSRRVRVDLNEVRKFYSTRSFDATTIHVGKDNNEVTDLLRFLGMKNTKENRKVLCYQITQNINYIVGSINEMPSIDMNSIRNLLIKHIVDQNFRSPNSSFGIVCCMAKIPNTLQKRRWLYDEFQKVKKHSENKEHRDVGTDDQQCNTVTAKKNSVTVDQRLNSCPNGSVVIPESNQVSATQQPSSAENGGAIAEEKAKDTCCLLRSITSEATQSPWSDGMRPFIREALQSITPANQLGVSEWLVNVDVDDICRLHSVIMKLQNTIERLQREIKFIEKIGFLLLPHYDDYSEFVMNDTTYNSFYVYIQQCMPQLGISCDLNFVLGQNLRELVDGEVVNVSFAECCKHDSRGSRLRFITVTDCNVALVLVCHAPVRNNTLLSVSSLQEELDTINHLISFEGRDDEGRANCDVLPKLTAEVEMMIAHLPCTPPTLVEDEVNNSYSKECDNSNSCFTPPLLHTNNSSEEGEEVDKNDEIECTSPTLQLENINEKGKANNSFNSAAGVSYLSPEMVMVGDTASISSHTKHSILGNEFVLHKLLQKCMDGKVQAMYTELFNKWHEGKEHSTTKNQFTKLIGFLAIPTEDVVEFVGNVTNLKTSALYQSIEECLPSLNVSCVCIFTGTRILQHVVGRVPMYTSYIKCKHNTCCRKFRFYSILDRNVGVVMVQSNDVPVLHGDPLTSQCRGVKRQLVKAGLSTTTPMKYRDEMVRRADESLYIRGNAQNIRTLSVLHKINSEAKKVNLRHEDDIIDLNVRYEEERTLESSEKHRYIQCVQRPLSVYLYSVYVIENVYMLNCDTKVGLHLDATGSLVRSQKKLYDKGEVYYYAGVCSIAGKIIPLMEMISIRHNVQAITNFLTVFKDSCKSIKLWPLFKYVVMDQSFAIINSVCLAFNEVRLYVYLRMCFMYCIHVGEWKAIQSKTVLHICCAHYVKSIKRYCVQKLQLSAKKAGKNHKNRLRFIMESVALLVSCRQYGDVVQVYSSFITVLLHKFVNEAVVDAKESIHSLQKVIVSPLTLSTDKDDEEEIEEKVVFKEDDVEVLDGLRKKSPFGKHFSLLYEEVCQLAEGVNKNTSTDKVKKSEEQELNAFYCPTFAEYFTKVQMPLLPLWSNVMTPVHDESSEIQRSSNATVESWFNVVKNHIFLGKRKLQPGLFIEEMKKNIFSVVKELVLLNATCSIDSENVKKKCSKTRKHDAGDLDAPLQNKRPKTHHKDVDNLDVKEKWRKKRGNKKFNYFNGGLLRHLSDNTKEMAADDPTSTTGGFAEVNTTTHNMGKSCLPTNDTNTYGINDVLHGVYYIDEDSDDDWYFNHTIQDWNNQNISTNRNGEAICVEKENINIINPEVDNTYKQSPTSIASTKTPKDSANSNDREASLVREDHFLNAHPPNYKVSDRKSVCVNAVCSETELETVWLELANMLTSIPADLISIPVHKNSQHKFLYFEDFGTLHGTVDNGCLTSAVMDECGLAMMDAMMGGNVGGAVSYIVSTYSHYMLGYDADEKQSKLEGALEIGIGNLMLNVRKMLLIPFQPTKLHYALCIIRHINGSENVEFEIIDSLSRLDIHTVDRYLKQFQKFIEIRNKWTEEKIDCSTWQAKASPAHCMQMDTVNCGVYVLWYMEQILRQLPLNQSMCPINFRKKLYWYITRKFEQPVTLSATTPTNSTASSCFRSGLVKNADYYIARFDKSTRYVVAVFDGTPISIHHERIMVYGTDFQSLANKNWLTGLAIDGAINAVLRSLSNVDTSRYCFVPTDHSEKCLAKSFNAAFAQKVGIPINNLHGKVYVIPFNVDKTHWVLLTIDPDAGTFCLYNSLDQPDKLEARMKRVVWNFVRNLNKFLPIGKRFENKDKVWRNVTPVHYPKQTDAYNCGLFVISYCIYTVTGKFLQMEDMRERVQMQLLQYSDNMTNHCLLCGEHTSPKYVKKCNTIDWLRCDLCDRWVHYDCIEDKKYSLKKYERKERNYNCPLCDRNPPNAVDENFLEHYLEAEQQQANYKDDPSSEYEIFECFEEDIS